MLVKLRPRRSWATHITTIFRLVCDLDFFPGRMLVAYIFVAITKQVMLSQGSFKSYSSTEQQSVLCILPTLVIIIAQSEHNMYSSSISYYQPSLQSLGPV